MQFFHGSSTESARPVGYLVFSDWENPEPPLACYVGRWCRYGLRQFGYIYVRVQPPYAYPADYKNLEGPRKQTQFLMLARRHRGLLTSALWLLRPWLPSIWSFHVYVCVLERELGPSERNVKGIPSHVSTWAEFVPTLAKAEAKIQALTPSPAQTEDRALKAASAFLQGSIANVLGAERRCEVRLVRSAADSPATYKSEIHLSITREGSLLREIILPVITGTKKESITLLLRRMDTELRDVVKSD